MYVYTILPEGHLGNTRKVRKGSMKKYPKLQTATEKGFESRKQRELRASEREREQREREGDSVSVLHRDLLHRLQAFLLPFPSSEAELQGLCSQNPFAESKRAEAFAPL
jgi:hypothetical protein